jgi:hypothetical protein
MRPRRKYAETYDRARRSAARRSSVRRSSAARAASGFSRRQRAIRAVAHGRHVERFSACGHKERFRRGLLSRNDTKNPSLRARRRLAGSSNAAIDAEWVRTHSSRGRPLS